MNFDLKNWKINNRKLANPFVIIWRLFWWVPLQICLIVTCIFAAIGFGKDAAKDIWKQIN